MSTTGNRATRTRTAHDTAAAMRAPTIADVDPRLLAGAGRMELGRVITDHDTPVGTYCPRCGWPVGGVQRACPSRALARAIRERRALPGWLLHLVDDIPGARAPAVPVDPQQSWAAEDALPGLFDAPLRQVPELPSARNGGELR